jgi:thioredoxin-like negative regulator of GroEL
MGGSREQAPTMWAPSSLAVKADDLGNYPVLVLHCWAEWDQPDREMSRRLDVVTSPYADRICFRSCDIDVPENLPFFLSRLANIPALVCFIRGEWFETVVGLRSEDELRSLFDRWLAAAVDPVPRRPRTASGLVALVGRLLGRGSRS